MNKKANSIIFLVVSTILNLILMLGVIILLLMISTAVLKHVIGLPDGHQAYSIMMLICLVLGVVSSFIINQRVTAKIVIKFNLDDKFEDDWSGKKKKGTSAGDPVQTTTNLPDSAKLSEEEKEERERWGE
ncbi:MAG: hypothetical protein J5780_06910 [Treponema sp.]|nr:hypothetical protein [Treponema sp.]